MEINQKIAMFIDADNAPAKKIEKILSEVAKYGSLSIRKAYGNWKSPSIKGWEDTLHEYSIQPVQQFDLTKGKNATDMAMTIDVMDALYTKNIDAFCIVSSDSDFTPLIMRILAEGKMVYGFGERKAPKPFVNACSRFLYLDDSETAIEEAAVNKKKTGSELKADTKLMNLIRNAINAEQDEEGWAYLGRIGSIISNQASIDPRNYGYKKLGDLIKAVDIFETKLVDSAQMYVRDKRRGNRLNKLMPSTAEAPAD
ncbi:MAG: hypothetical protein CL693_00455 [Cellvibrionaceae bacterium]|nr:hypothetical protein [Cellvibrionaceae bacterium]|tara:strand:+ start:30507 stop:31271 length:765 start_codon:yes stop_codon:yes gene_type:complete